MIKLQLIHNYRSLSKDISGQELTDELIREIYISEGIKPPDIVRNERGKPRDAKGETFFSVSHTGDVFALAIGSSEIGLDIQKKLPKNMDIFTEKFFGEDDAPVEGPLAPSEFLRIWTRKEALVKYLDDQLVRVLREEPVLGRRDVRFLDLDLGDGLYGAICISMEDDDHEIRISHRKQD